MSSLSSNIHNEAAILEQVAISGRKTELRQLLKALTLCRSGQGKAIFLSGNEGIGKSALLNTFLDLAYTVYGCQVVSVRLLQANRETLFVRIIEDILQLSNRIIDESLQKANRILNPLAIYWDKNDLIRIIALIHLQEAVGRQTPHSSAGNRQSAISEQLSQSILKAIPFFRRFGSSAKKQIEELAEILSDPWITLAVSIVNPVNPHVQDAISLVRKIVDPYQLRVKQLGSSINPPLLTGSVETQYQVHSAQYTVAEHRTPDTETLDTASSEEEALFDKEKDKLPDIQSALINFLVFVNSGLRREQTALILAFDQWETAWERNLIAQCGKEEGKKCSLSPIGGEGRGEGKRKCSLSSNGGEDRSERVKEVNDLLSEVVRQVVEQRDSRLMLIVSSRSETESYAAGGNLYNALKTKYLVPPLGLAAGQRFLKDSLKALGIQSDDEVNSEILRLCHGNPAWITIMASVIKSEMGHLGLNFLDWQTYQEHFSVNNPLEILDIIYTKLQLMFVGAETIVLKMLSKILSSYAYVPFTRSQLLQLFPRSSEEDTTALVDPLLNALLQHGFLEVVSHTNVGARLVPALETRVSIDASTDEEVAYRFYNSFLLAFLMEKIRPIQEEIPSADKVASLKKILPLSIQSGELTKEKTQEILAMASALENPELQSYVEHTLISALNAEGATSSVQVAILESLSLLMTEASIKTIISMLNADDSSVREAACIQLIPFAGRSKSDSIPKRAIVEAILPLIQDLSEAVRYQAYQFFSLCRSEDVLILPVLIDGSINQSPTVRILSLTGLSRRGQTSTQIFEAFHRAIESETEDISVFKAALKGLHLFDKDKVTPVLKDYLSNHTQQSPFWIEAMMQLINLDLGEALPSILAMLQGNQEIDIKLRIVKRLGSQSLNLSPQKSHEVEKILVTLLQNSSNGSFLPELRWMTIRSLGWIGQSEESLRVLRAQQPACQSDEILNHTLQGAIRQVSERLAVPVGR